MTYTRTPWSDYWRLTALELLVESLWDPAVQTDSIDILRDAISQVPP